MSGVLRKLHFLRSKLSRRKPEPEEFTEEKWIADFGKEKHSRFDIKSESSYDANIRRGAPSGFPRAAGKSSGNSGYSLVLALKKESCIAWVEAPEQRYRDMVLSGALRVDARGGYAAAGIHFRMVDDTSYYSFLISSKGYFRLDLVRNGMPFPLIGWTELPLFKGAMIAPDQSVDFSLIAYGSHIVILIRGHWAAEINDPSISEGTVCFAAASYKAGDPAYQLVKDTENYSYSAEAFLESLTIDSRITEVEAAYEKWRDDGANIDPQARINLAETFTAMNQHNAALVQLHKAWKTPGREKTQKELLLAGRLAQQLNLVSEAETYISQCFQMNVHSAEGKEAVAEMAKILYAGERFTELRNYCAEAIKIKTDDPLLWTFRGHASWNLKDYKNAAAAYDRAFELDRENGIHGKNAANVYEVMGRKKEALSRYIEAGKAFLKAGNHNDLGLLIPKILSIGEDNWEGRSLAGKWAFAVEDWKMAEEEFGRAETLRKAKRPKPRKDGAQVFLEALLLIRAGKRREALPLFEEAAGLEKDFALFHFRLAENMFLLENNPEDPKMLDEMNTALALAEADLPRGEDPAAETNKGPDGAGRQPEDAEEKSLSGWIHNFAAQVALSAGNLESAAVHLEKAAQILGDLPAVRVNRGVFFFLDGSPDKALELLAGESQDDPEGIMANCAGNLLVRSGRFEEADEKYRKALAAAPDSVEYLTNRATCLMELGLYGEADTLLARAHGIAPNPDILEMISYVAAKKGEYPRAAEACRLALEMDPKHAPSLLSLGWISLSMGKQKEAAEILRRLDELRLEGDAAKGREELRVRLEDRLYLTTHCASCERSWKTPQDVPSVPAIRLFAMPPDDLPAGSCQICGKTYCIGCAKKNLDSKGRFICPDCGKSLKLVNAGLKKLVYDWAVKDGLINKPSTSGEVLNPSTQINTEPVEIKKRGRGRPRKQP